FVWDDFEVKYIRTGAGDFLIRKWKINQHRYLAAVIPLHIHYKIQNEYLGPVWNRTIFSGYEVEILDASGAIGEEVKWKGKIIFRCQVLPDYFKDISAEIFAIVLFTISLLFFFLILYRFNKQIRGKHPTISFLLLAFGILGVRYLMIEFQFPSRFVDIELFDPKYFASSFFNPSMGDLVLNLVAVTAICFILFRKYSRFEGIRLSLRTRMMNWIISMFSTVAILFGALFPFVVIQTLYNNSGITLNISQSIHFDSLRILAYISLVLSWVSSFLFMHVFLRILMNDRNFLRIGISLLGGSILFSVINLFSGQLYLSSLLIGMSFTIVVMVFKLYRSLQQFHFVTFVYFFLIVVAHSLNGLVAITHFSTAQKVNDQSRFADAFLIDRDDFGEFLLDEAIQKISGDLFIQTRISGPFMNKEAVRQKVRQVFVPRYFNKYSTKIHLFGPSGDPLDDDNNLNFADRMSTLDLGSTPTGYKGVFLVNRPNYETTRKYIAAAPVKRGEITMGYIVIEFTLKRIIPENVYPDLLVDSRFQQAFRSQDFSYAVFVNDEIRFRSGDFNYNSLNINLLESPDLRGKGVDANQFLHVGTTDSNGRTVVVSSPLPPFIFRLADFSFLVINGLAAILLYLFIVGVTSALNHQRLMMSARIQLILNFSFFIPLIGVSIITVGLTAKSNQRQLNTEYLAKSRNFTNEIHSMLNEQTVTQGMEYEQNFAQLSKLSNLDANLFSPTGKLQVASQPLIFENQLLAPYINPRALIRFQLGDRAFIEGEHVGNLDYFVAYSGVYSPQDGSLLGIAAIPFFQSAYLLEKMQIIVLANVLSLFTAIFIVLLVISFWLSKWLTFPLRMITQKLGRISLTQSNQPLEWKSDDEIGLMVKEYNQMLSTLSENKAELERTNRERAWREIAQQVAHEIKNPLTPIKLTLQKLERISESDPQRNEKLKKAIASILAQVDSLDDVATSFSTFAKMPEPIMDNIELIELVKNTINLHDQVASISFNTDLIEVYVYADKQLLGRIFSNILLNSIQAARPNLQPVIEVSLNKNEHAILIRFSDNGVGIDESASEKIFLPHFSTKQSGSGLGLAIARQ
ncbi:MAG: HAMP domain-containing histidine kinase, partial [Cyclobacteriaceae bacterium]|nr:HAMP domain-containing histidine kinase [Cyclobacteriaceae bacterium]